MTNILYVVILLVSIFEALAQSSIHYSNISNNYIFFGLGIFFYCIVSFLIYKAYDFKGVGMVNALWSGMSILLMTMIGIFIFNEKITTMECIGIVLIVIGILFTHHHNVIHFPVDKHL